MKPSGNIMLITGGGSGIGEALAHRFHDRGNTVIVAGRRQEVLQRACSGRDRMHAALLDVESGDAVDAFAAQIVRDHPALNVLVNNAGIMRLEDVAGRRDLRDAEETVAINLLGPIRLTNALVDHLGGQADAAIVNVTSGLAFVPLVAAATYSATKAAMHAYTVSLREALRGRVEVIELAPPAVQTALTPGQESRPGYLPLADFADEVLALFEQDPTPVEILVRRVLPLRRAEAEGRFDEALKTLNDFATRVRQGDGDA